MPISLDGHYAALEDQFPLVSDPNYERLVVPQGAADESVHRWFRMKEAFSPSLLQRVLKDLSLEDRTTVRLHDPFLGSGTTLTSALLTPDGPLFQASGVELNPFLHLLSSTKVRALSLSQDDREHLRARLDAAVPVIVTAATGAARAPARPKLHAFRETAYFPPEHLRRLMKMRKAVDGIGGSLVADLLRVCLAGAIEPSSRLRRDGRALRFEPQKVPEDPVQAFKQRAGLIANDLSAVRPRGRGVVSHGSSIVREGWPKSGGSLDLVCFSPPYPNNIDYTEVYKLENWLLGLIADAESFAAERRLTVRSHPSVAVPERELPIGAELEAYVDTLAAPITDAIPNDRYRHQRRRVVRGYLRDMASTLTCAQAALRRGGDLVYVVGNSRHGAGEAQYTIASDVLMAALADRIGFEVREVRVARRLHRRGRHEHLRESVVFLRKRA